MVVVITKVILHPHKRKEFLQTAQVLLKQIRNEQGCLSYGLYQDMEDENNFCFVEEWQTQEDLDNYFRTKNFSVLVGAISVLGKSSTLQIHTLSHTVGMEAVEAVRKFLKKQ